MHKLTLAELQNQWAQAIREGGAGWGVYYRNYRYNRTDALAQVFPSLSRLLGQEVFLSMALNYVDVNLSGSACLFDEGRGLPSFLRQHPSLNDLPQLAELAEWDMAVHKAFLAEDSDPGTHWKIRADLQTIHATHDLQSFFEGMGLALLPTPRNWAIWRQDGGIAIEVIDAQLANFLIRCQCACELEETLRTSEIAHLHHSLQRQWLLPPATT